MEEVKSYKNKDLLNEDFQYAELPPIRNDFIAKLENALMFLSYEDKNMFHSEAGSIVSLRQFDGAWLMDISLRHKEGEGFVFKPYGDLQVTPDIFPDLNIKIMNLSGEIGYLSKHRFLTPKEKRHLENYRYIYSEKLAFLDYAKQKWWLNEGGFGFNNIREGKDLRYILPIPVSLKPGYVIEPKDAMAHINSAIETKDAKDPYMVSVGLIHMALQLSLTYYYEWSCYIREDKNSIGIRIPIHPSSSKEVFIMRNIPEGAQRKKAIVNFVKDHYRTITGFNGNEREILVNKHLRGELKFNWRGLEVHVTPSAYDLNRVKTTKKFPKQLTR